MAAPSLVAPDGSVNTDQLPLDGDVVSSTDGVQQIELKEKILKRLIEAAKKNQKIFFDMGEKINKYAYRRGAVDKQPEADLQLPFTAVLSKASQYVDVIGNELFQKNPDHRANPRPWADQQAIQRAQLMQDMLNYTASQDNEEDEHRKAVIDSIIYGKGVVRSGWNDEKKLPQDMHVSIKDFYWDPDATGQADCHWKAQKRRKPRWWLYKNIPGCEAILDGKSGDAKKPSENPTGTDYSVDTFAFYEVYLDHGLSNYQDGVSLLNKTNDQDVLTGSDDPVYYVFTEEGKILLEKPWQVPLWKRQKWPFQELDLKTVPGSYEGRSPLEAGLPQLETMDFLYKISIVRMRQSAHAALIHMVANGQKVGAENADRIANATSEDGILQVLEVVWDGMGEAPDINKMLQVFNIKSNLDEFIKAIQFNSEEFEKATGLYGILYMGQTDTQMRSAQDVAFKEKTSRSRIDAMVSKVEQWASSCATVRAAILRFLATTEDVEAVLGPQLAQQWGFLMPLCADEAEDKSQALQQQGCPPDMADQIGKMEAELEQLDLKAQGGVDFDTWLNEADYAIVAGTCVAVDADEIRALMDKLNVQVVPELLGNPNPMMQAVALAMQLENFKSYNAPARIIPLNTQAIGILTAPPPPPPPGMMPPGGPPGPGGPPPQVQGPHVLPAPNRPGSQPQPGPPPGPVRVN